MKRALFIAINIVVFLLFADFCRAQVYDLIVTSKGDSIACRIDSITKSNIYFKMKIKGSWNQTYLSLDMASFFERNAIEKKKYLFESGSSIIKSAFKRKLPRNSVYAGIGSLNYARTFLGNPFGITLAGGILYIDAPGILLESTFLVGGSKHLFEPGILAYHLFNTETSPDDNNSLTGISIRMGYRYQGPRGFLFRAAPVLSYVDGGFVVLPALSLGYSF